MGDETLLERILSGDEDPKDLPLALLKSIRNNFSDDKKIGQGGFGAIYKESTYLDDDMLRIEPLELKLNEEMSWSVKLTNKTKASFAFNIERPSQQYTIWPDKGIVTPGCNEYLVQITLQPQQRAPQVTQNVDKIIFQSTKVPEGLRDEDITENIFHEEAGKVVDEVNLMIVYEPTKPKENCKSREDTNMPAEEVPEAKGRKIVESAFGKGKLGSSEKAEAASMAERIVGSLEDSTKDLIAKKNDVCQKIKNAERQGKKSTNEVDRWLEKVAKIIDVVHVISLECKLKKDVTMEASEKLREVQECLSSCPSSVAIESMPPPVHEMPGSSMSAEDLNLQEALHLIKDEPTVGMIGIWGPGGVGKTHLLRSINNSFGEGMDFNFVLFVTASRGCSVEKVQSQIIERFKLPSSGSKSRTIYEYMKTKSFLVLLDDLWDEIDLEDVGIPYPLGSLNNLNRKVVLTTRLRKVCGQMKVKKEVKVAYLQEHEAWQLFEENIGAETLSSPHIKDLARELMKELKGLPLALITIGKAMYQKNEYQWETAIQYMKQSCCADDKDPIELGMETNVFKKLKFSYDNLRDDTLRACFLTCVLWPEDEQISKVDLAKCWMGLGLVNGPDIESSFRKSYSLIADLTAACLLDGCEYDDIPLLLFQKSDVCVKVHDVIRDMALWISCDCGEKNDKWIVAAPGGRDQKVIMLSNNAECISLMSNTIPIRLNLDPLNLRILCLPNNGLDESIIVEAIKNCSSLTYLDLRGNKLMRIPEELCSLVKLEYLDLSENEFGRTKVPHSFGKLINLKFLYLESICNGDVRIPAGVISSLKALQVIYLGGSIPKWIFLELGTLPQLKSLGIGVQDFALFKSLLGEAANLPVRYLNMQSVGADLTGILSTDFAQRTLYELDITDEDYPREITVRHHTEEQNNHFGALNYLRLSMMLSLREIMWMGATPAFIFPRLTCLELFRCTSLSHLSWAMYLPRLERLIIVYCNGVVQAFMRCHGDKLCNGQDKTKTFPCLRFLRLNHNTSLEAIGDKGMEFPSLERLELVSSPKLKRLPFQLDSLPPKLKELWFSDAKDWETLECEQGVKTLLQPLLKFGLIADLTTACDKTTVRALSAPVILKGQAGSSPHPISLQHLKDITDNFSADRILGSGGFGEVYKGVLHGEIVAVKKLKVSTPLSHKQFENEIDLLMTLEHPNIVRLVGYCYDTQEALMSFEGKMVVAHRIEWLLCLECMPNGSLDKYISDASSGLDWHKRCKIIEGISFGLKYLHEEANDPIIHLDLKPANILLGENLVPKITDFGLSRLFDKKTMHTTVASGTFGYMALEYQQRGIITPMADIFSLGVIILEVITGHRDYPYDIRRHSEEFIELELQKWRNRLHKEPVYTSLEIHCQQIERYIQIGLICVNTEREKRPTMNKIIDMLQGLESMDWYIRNELSSQNIMEEQ